MGDKKATSWALLQVSWQPRASMDPADGLHACNTQSNPNQRLDTSEGLLVKVDTLETGLPAPRLVVPRDGFCVYGLKSLPLFSLLHSTTTDTPYHH